jgi:hypothetical protein
VVAMISIAVRQVRCRLFTHFEEEKYKSRLRNYQQSFSE